jgi:hypothetical protein
VRVLGQPQRLEATLFGSACELGGIHRLVGGEDEHSQLHRSLPAVRCDDRHSLARFSGGAEPHSAGAVLALRTLSKTEPSFVANLFDILSVSEH